MSSSATSSFDISGSASGSASRVRIVTRFVRASKPASSWPAAFATRRSKPFCSSFRAAFARRSSVSSANPTVMLPALRSPAVPAATSGFAVMARSSPSPVCSRLSLRPAAVTGRKSATAAAKIDTSASGRCRATASLISTAVSTVTRRGPKGGATEGGPETTVTSAPRRQAAAAIAKPIRPEERLPTYRTGSMGSRVGPAVTRTRRPEKASWRPSARPITSSISDGSSIRPGPSPSPTARAPSPGPATS